MNKEVFKTIILIMLTISAGLLVVKVWVFDNAMISENSTIYQFAHWFQTGLKYGFDTQEADVILEEQPLAQTLFYPTELVLSWDTSHYMPLYDQAQIDAMNETGKVILQASMENENVIREIADVSVFEAKLEESDFSMYLRYSASIDFSLFAQYLQLTKNVWEQVPAFDKVLFSQDALTNTYTVYYLNDEMQNVYSAQGFVTQEIANAILAFEQSRDNLQPCVFGFEQGSMNGLALVDDALIPMNRSITNKLIEKKVLVETNDSFLSVVFENVLQLFEYDTSVRTWYDDVTGSQLYVKNSGTLSFSDSGCLEYRAVDAQSGISVEGFEDIHTMDQKQILNISTSFLSKVGQSALGGDGVIVRYAGMEQNTNDETIRVYFDYVVQGIPVRSDQGVKGYPIVIDINNYAQITYAKIYAVTLEQTQDIVLNMDIGNLSGLLAHHVGKTMDSLSLVYRLSDVSNVLVTNWNYILYE